MKNVRSAAAAEFRTVLKSISVMKHRRRILRVISGVYIHYNTKIYVTRGPGLHTESNVTPEIVRRSNVYYKCIRVLINIWANGRNDKILRFEFLLLSLFFSLSPRVLSRTVFFRPEPKGNTILEIKRKKNAHCIPRIQFVKSFRFFFFLSRD